MSSKDQRANKELPDTATNSKHFLLLLLWWWVCMCSCGCAAAAAAAAVVCAMVYAVVACVPVKSAVLS